MSDDELLYYVFTAKAGSTEQLKNAMLEFLPTVRAKEGVKYIRVYQSKETPAQFAGRACPWSSLSTSALL
jgi:quinol monooxygenase YgiN